MTEQEIKLPIEWCYPDDLITRYSNNIVVQHTKNEFILSFFEVRPPVIFGELEHVQQELDKMASIRAECIARIVVSPEQIANFIKALQDNFDKYKSRVETASEE